MGRCTACDWLEIDVVLTTLVRDVDDDLAIRYRLMILTGRAGEKPGGVIARTVPDRRIDVTSETSRVAFLPDDGITEGLTAAFLSNKKITR